MAERSPAQIFRDHAEGGRLAYQVDADGRAVFYPRHGPYEWRTSAGLGTVYATTVVRRRGEEARNLALIDLDEGFRIMSRVEGLAPTDVRIGQRVRVGFDGQGVPVFEPEG